MATTVERLGIVETKVENLNEKLDDLKAMLKKCMIVSIKLETA